MKLDTLRVKAVRDAAAKLAEAEARIQDGTRQAAALGCWSIFKMNVPAALDQIAALADANDDAAMLVRLHASMTFPDRWVVWYRVTVEGRARLAAAQLFAALKGDGSYATVKANINLLEIVENPLRIMARDANLLQSLDAPDSYLGRSKLVQTTSGTGAKIQPHHEEWYLNQALLLQALEANQDPEIKSRLAVIMLQSFNKAAKVNEGEQLRYISTPFSDPTRNQAYGVAPLYHRSTPANQLLKKCAEAIAAKMPVAGDHWFTPRPVHNATFREVMRRAFAFKDVTGKVASEGEFNDAVDALLVHVEGGEIPAHPVGLDVSALHASKRDGLGADLEGLFGVRKEAFVKRLREAALGIGELFDEARVRSDVDKLRSQLFAFVLTKWRPPGAPDLPPSLDGALATAVDAPEPQRILECGMTVDMVRITPRLTVQGAINPSPERFANPPIDLLMLPKAFCCSGTVVGTILEGVDHALIHTGYRLDPLQTKKIWAAMKSYRDILREGEIELTKLATGGSKIPVICPGWPAFLDRSAVKAFAALPTEDVPPYVKVLAKATSDLLRGLGDYTSSEMVRLYAYFTKSAALPAYAGTGTVTVKPQGLARAIHRDPAGTVAAGALAAVELGAMVPLYLRGEAAEDLKVTLTLAPSNDQHIVVSDAVTCQPFGEPPEDPDARGGIDKSYHARGLTDLLQTSYYRMIDAMGAAALRRDDLVTFLNQIEIIHQEIAAIITLVEPYPRGAFQDAFNAAVAPGDMIPAGMRPARVHLKPSAMHCLASIAAAIEAVSPRGHRLNVLFLQDCYYEESAALSEWRSYTHFQLAGDTFEITVSGAPVSLRDVDKDDPLWNPLKPIDFFICDFHHNISVDRDHYKVEDLAAQVRLLIDKGLVADRFTVAIDCTIDLIRSPDVKAFLEAFATEIGDGSLNVVLFRSAQKFDMLGMDNFYGGYTATINDGVGFAPFNTRMDDPDDQLEGANRQGLTHLMKYASASLDDYRLAAMRNTKLLYDAIPADCKHGSLTPGHMLIGRIDDPRAAFLDIRFPGAKGDDNAKKVLADKVEVLIVSFALAEKLVLTTRASFGFPTTNFTKIAGSKVRLNPGLEPAATMTKYASFFKRVHEHLESKALDRVSGSYTNDLGAALDGLKF